MTVHSAAYRRWYHMRFPPGGTTDPLLDIKGDLAGCDAGIAGIVLALDAAGNVRDIEWPVLDLLAEVDNIIARLEAFSPPNDEDGNLRLWQLDYAQALRAVYVEALAQRNQ